MTEYTCPMHPQIRQSGPGACPICGMDLEPIQVSDEENQELKEMKLRFWIALFLSIPILLPLPEWVHGVLASPIVCWAGWPFFWRAGVSIRNRQLNMFTLIGLGVGSAYIYSLISLLFPFIFPFSPVPNYFEAAAVITVLVLLGQVLELNARAKTGRAIRALLNLAPKAATLVFPNGEEKIVALDEVKKGDLLRIHPGEKIPVDGVVFEGSSTLNESMMTGEPVSIEKKPGDPVIGGTVNERGSLLIRAEKVGRETLLAQIVEMVTVAQRSRAPIQNLADSVSAYFVPAVICIALLTFLGWFWLGPQPSFSYGIINAVSVLIIACPCALGLATPMSVMVGIGEGAKNGILIKNAEVLERMENVDTVVVDKTGTLTEGKMHLNAVVSLGNLSEESLLQWAASVEIHSEHPLSSAIVKKAKEKGLPLIKAENFESISGKGVSGKINQKTVSIGNAQLIPEQSLAHFSQTAESLRQEGQTVMFIAIDHQLEGLLAFSDPIKLSSFEAIEQLHRDGIQIVMLTGDHSMTAEVVAKKLGIDEVHAEILPEDKYKIVQALQMQGRFVAMAGDGINDAPALAEAHVGIAMGTGTDVAMESAGITLIKGDLRGIVRARKLSEATMRNIRQNLWFAFLYNSLGVPIAAGLFYPFFGILLSPMIASAAMSLSSVSVIWNALRLRLTKGC